MVVGEVPERRIRWSAEAGGQPKVRIGGASTRGGGRHRKEIIGIQIITTLPQKQERQPHDCVLYSIS